MRFLCVGELRLRYSLLGSLLSVSSVTWPGAIAIFYGVSWVHRATANLFSMRASRCMKRCSSTLVYTLDLYGSCQKIYEHKQDSRIVAVNLTIFIRFLMN